MSLRGSCVIASIAKQSSGWLIRSPDGFAYARNDGMAAANRPAQTSRIGAKPPWIRRLPSKGMLAPISFMRGSFIIFSLAASAVALSAYSSQEKMTTSQGSALTAP